MPERRRADNAARAAVNEHCESARAAESGRLRANARSAAVSAAVLAGERVLPVAPALTAVFTGNGLQRGATVVVDAHHAAPGAVSLALALVAEASATGSWAAVVGVPDLGLLTAAELGVQLERLALVPDVAPAQWVTVVGALLDAVDLVIAHPPAHLRGGDARRLTARARERGSTLIPLRPGRAWADGADVRLTVAGGQWAGAGAGEGHLTSRELTVTMGGRGAAARARTVRLWLPAPGGGVAAADAFAGADIDRLPLPTPDPLQTAG
jgi:hypothetical protein